MSPRSIKNWIGSIKCSVKPTYQICPETCLKTYVKTKSNYTSETRLSFRVLWSELPSTNLYCWSGLIHTSYKVYPELFSQQSCGRIRHFLLAWKDRLMIGVQIMGEAPPNQNSSVKVWRGMIGGGVLTKKPVGVQVGRRFGDGSEG